ncbi:hypothetical protein KIN20_001568 [Parelaphostrongylus tenuis]|uniref:Uncharacterized protein n=1 Tax=Parelaphostrongylus tenuis TaxID=148309 RepID=A0AAD5MMB4_PARTN|nr:hypothetical protein KIN20_001568 [Parelaphostrongylus tenuis]
MMRLVVEIISSQEDTELLRHGHDEDKPLDIFVFFRADDFAYQLHYRRYRSVISIDGTKIEESRVFTNLWATQKTEISTLITKYHDQVLLAAFQQTRLLQSHRVRENSDFPRFRPRQSIISINTVDDEADAYNHRL